MSTPMLSALDWGVHISTVSDEWMIHSLPKARYSADGGRVPGRAPGRLRRIMRAATRFGSYRVECEGVLRGHKKPDYTTRSDSLSAEHHLSKLFRGGVAKSASQNTDTERLTWVVLQNNLIELSSAFFSVITKSNWVHGVETLGKVRNFANWERKNFFTWCKKAKRAKKWCNVKMRMRCENAEKIRIASHR
jgi:hypothetical protein